MTNLARMRTIDQAIEQLRKDDPQSSLTRHALRQMVLTGHVPHVKAGSKYLLNYDGLLAVLAGETKTVESDGQYGNVRPVGR